MSEDSFVYVFTLTYTPSPLGNSPIVRTREVSVSIQCHYQRSDFYTSRVCVSLMFLDIWHEVPWVFVLCSVGSMV